MRVPGRFAPIVVGALRPAIIPLWSRTELRRSFIGTRIKGFDPFNGHDANPGCRSAAPTLSAENPC